MERNERIKAIAAELWKASTTDDQNDVYNEWYVTKFTRDDIEKALTEYASCNIWGNMKFIERNDRAPRRTRVVGASELFGDIDKMQSFLKELKDEGFSEIEERWCGYEDSYFVAIKYGREGDDEYYGRLQNEINPYMRAIEDNKRQIEKKKKRIAELESEIKKLKKEIE